MKTRRSLAYSCNCGWLDLGHMNPENTRDPDRGAANLWRQICDGDRPGNNAMYTAALAPEMWPVSRFSHQSDPYRFPDGATGYAIRFKMTQCADLRVRHVCVGPDRGYLIRFGLTPEQKKSVALGIFMKTSLDFETMQSRPPTVWKSDSGFSQEDLPSNLIGFYIAVGEITREEVARVCHILGEEESAAIWDRHGAVGQVKNREFKPILDHCTREPDAPAPSGDDTDASSPAVIDYCQGQPRTWPEIFTRIKPAPEGFLWRTISGW